MLDKRLIQRDVMNGFVKSERSRRVSLWYKRKSPTHSITRVHSYIGTDIAAEQHALVAAFRSPSRSPASGHANCPHRIYHIAKHTTNTCLVPRLSYAFSSTPFIIETPYT